MSSHKIKCLRPGVCRDTWAAGASFILKPVGTHRIAFWLVCLVCRACSIWQSQPIQSRNRRAVEESLVLFPAEHSVAAWAFTSARVLCARVDVYSRFQLCTFIPGRISEQRPPLPRWAGPALGGCGTPPAMVLPRTLRASAFCHFWELEEQSRSHIFPLQAVSEVYLCRANPASAPWAGASSSTHSCPHQGFTDRAFF